jgi:hypothetical protein
VPSAADAPDGALAAMVKATDPLVSPGAMARPAGADASNLRYALAGADALVHPPLPASVESVTAAEQPMPDGVMQAASTGIDTRSPARTRTGGV